MQPSGAARLTYDDLLSLPDDNLRHEIIDGQHFVTPSPVLRHQTIVGRLYFEIELFARMHPGCGRVFVAPVDVVFSHWDVVVPDLLFVAADRLDALTPKNVQGAPSLIVEVLSPGTRRRDRSLKRRLFEREGVGEYWMVDPDTDTVAVLRREAEGAMSEVDTLSLERDQVLTTPLLPSLRLSVRDLLARD